MLRVCLIVAHPDDETLFFGPTIRSIKKNQNNIRSLTKHSVDLAKNGVELHLLCLSTGNFYGMGRLRTAEMFASCEVHGIDRTSVHILDEPDLQDGRFTEKSVARVVDKFLSELSVDVTITFDEFGASGHKDHCATANGVKKSVRKNENIVMLELVTAPVWSKYLGLPAIVVALVTDFIKTHVRREKEVPAHVKLLFPHFPLAVCGPSDIAVNGSALLRHKSQLVWYRILFFFFASYTFFNTLRVVQSSKLRR